MYFFIWSPPSLIYSGLFVFQAEPWLWSVRGCDDGDLLRLCVEKYVSLFIMRLSHLAAEWGQNTTKGQLRNVLFISNYHYHGLNLTFPTPLGPMVSNPMTAPPTVQHSVLVKPQTIGMILGGLRPYSIPSFTENNTRLFSIETPVSFRQWREGEIAD